MTELGRGDPSRLAGNLDAQREFDAKQGALRLGLDLSDTSREVSPEERSLLEQSREALARRDAARAAALEGQGANEAYGELGTMGSASQPAGMGTPGGSLAEQELLAKARAAREAGTAQITGQTPQQAAAAAQAALAEVGRPRVLGMTKGGFQPATRANQTQRERTEMPPGYTEVASEELRQNRLQGEAATEQALIAEAMARKSAKVRAKIGEIQQGALEKATDDEDRALQGAQDQIASIVQEFRAGGPKNITYTDIWKDNDTAGKVTMALGFVAGVLGSIGEGHQNEFVKRLDASIQRKIDIQERESERTKDAIGFAQTAYDVVRQKFRDRDTTRRMLQLIALQQFDQHVAEQAANLGLGSGNQRLAELRGTLLQKQRGIMKELSSKIVEQQANTEKFVPPTAILGGLGDVPKGAGEEATKYELERQKQELPQASSAVNELRALASSMTAEDRGILENLARRKAASEPGSWTEFLLRSHAPEKTQRMVGAVNTLVQALGGKTLPPQESQRYVSGFIGDGSPEAILRGADEAQRKIDKIEESLHAAFPQGYKVGNLRRGVYRNVDQPHELEGGEKAPDLNKRVISP